MWRSFVFSWKPWVIAVGTLYSGGCDVATGVIQTVLLAFDIVDVWV
jgi:hypothetical protein